MLQKKNIGIAALSRVMDQNINEMWEINNSKNNNYAVHKPSLFLEDQKEECLSMVIEDQ